MRHWDWDGMVEANRVRLIGLLAGVFTLLGPGVLVRRVLWRQVLARLVPMESALRRLIFIMARDMAVTAPTSRRLPRGGVPKGKDRKREPVFKLTDVMRDPTPKPRSAKGHGPRIAFLDEWRAAPATPVPSDDDWMHTGALRRRLAALQAALDDLPAQARRLARWYARRDRMRAAGKHARLYPIRSGRAPGHLQGGKRAVDEVLKHCHDLALDCRAMVEAEGR